MLLVVYCPILVESLLTVRLPPISWCSHREAPILRGVLRKSCQALGLLCQVVRLSELYGNHNPMMHGFINVIRSVGGQDNQSIVSERERGEGTVPANNINTIRTQERLKRLISLPHTHTHVSISERRRLTL